MFLILTRDFWQQKKEKHRAQILRNSHALFSAEKSTSFSCIIPQCFIRLLDKVGKVAFSSSPHAELVADTYKNDLSHKSSQYIISAAQNVKSGKGVYPESFAKWRQDFVQEKNNWLSFNT